MSSVHVTVKFFASVREIVGAHTTEIELHDDQTIAGLVQVLATRYPGLQESLITIAIALNRKYVDRKNDKSIVLRSGDELALIPPISGG
jgi:molybdopterin synthase sulfur carrier subunit